MPESLAREIGSLRTLATHLERRPLPFDKLTREWLRQEGLGHVREDAGGITCIRMPGHRAFTELTDCLLDRLPAMERSAIYADILHGTWSTLNTRGIDRAGMEGFVITVLRAAMIELETHARSSDLARLSDAIIFSISPSPEYVLASM